MKKNRIPGKQALGFCLMLLVAAALVLLSLIASPSASSPVVPSDTAGDSGKEQGETQPSGEEVREGRRLGFSCPDPGDSYYVAMKTIMEAELALEEEPVSLVSAPPATDPGTQLTQVREMLQQGIDALFLIPVRREAPETEQILQEVLEAGIPLINLDVPVTQEDLTAAYIGVDNRQAGRLCGQDLCRRLPQGGRIVLLEAPQDPRVNERITGFERAIANQGFEMIARISLEEDREAARTALLEVLSREGSVSAVMCGSDEMALLALDVLRTLGQEDTLLYGTEGSPALKAEMALGDVQIAGTSALSPLETGKKAVEVALDILADREVERETEIPVYFISREVLALYGSDGWQ